MAKRLLKIVNISVFRTIDESVRTIRTFNVIKKRNESLRRLEIIRDFCITTTIINGSS